MLAAPPNVLAIAAADPTGGAGLQADILTLASLGCHPLSVLTAFTVQDTRGVAALHSVSAADLAAQARCVLADAPARAIKIGVVGSAANAQAIAELLAEHAQLPVVLDPVLASARGDALGDEGTLHALRELLLPRATVATPNSIEARALGGAAAMIARGCKYVLVTGAHEPGDDVVNVLHGAAGVLREDRWPRLPGSFHGSGCTLASAIAARLAHGDEVPEAVRRAQDYTWCALERGYRPGAGQHVPDRLHAR
jgi:hydroxymethylpyrimidine/phosphomethylpyrimidine kinase